MKHQRFTTAATITILRKGLATPDDRFIIAQWLARKALDLINEGHLYGSTYKARYQYPTKK